MYRIILSALLLLTPTISALAQLNETDSVYVLDEVTTRAFEYNRPLQDIPAAVTVLVKKDFDRFNNTSILPAVNSIAGVRMEERSPGSYRLSIRGSTLRSPFGIRNVKVYWNDMPFTDPGGNTYLNLLDYSTIQQADIIKGPGSSLYGAGTGGVVLLKSLKPTYDQQQFEVSAVGGSFGMKRFNAGWQNSSAKSSMAIHYAHQQADGYRDQSSMQRDVLTAQGNFKVDEKRIVSVNLLYADLLYQTPGALTKAQFDTDPKQARPAGGPNPGAAQQKATIYNKTFYTSISQAYIISEKWTNRTGAYGTFTEFANPTIRNYERKTEQSYGIRSVTEYTDEKLKINFGGEYQHGFSPVKVYDNNSGNSGNLQSDDEIKSTSALLFAQADLTLPGEFYLTAGLSYNFYTVGFTRLSTPVTQEKRNFTPVLSPRIALLKKINNAISVYGSYSQGFSPPTVAELYPSTTVFDKNLEPEKGNNYELGLKGNLIDRTLQVDLTAYTFQLNKAIVSRRDTTLNDDPEYFINAGNTSQNGVEVSVAWRPRFAAGSFVGDFKVWTSYTLNDYYFKNYGKDTVNFSGNRLTGSPPNIFVFGIDLLTSPGIYLNLTANYVDHIPLDDANTAFAKEYKLLGARLGYSLIFSKNFPLDIFCGVDNIFNEKYSLGNDLNALAGRFYNAAAPRNFFVGLKSTLIVKKKN